MEALVYNKEGGEVGKIKLPEEIFDTAWNSDLIHRVAGIYAANKRAGTAHAKSRGEVRGGGKKPWRQKGTGRARHGSIRSPIWVGGGVTHGPRKDKDYGRKINKKEKSKALRVILSKKFKDGEILFVDSFDFTKPRAGEAKKTLLFLSRIKGFEGLASKKKNASLITFDKIDENTQKSFRNFGNLETSEIRNINLDLLLKYKYLIITNPEESMKNIPAGGF